MTHKKDETHWDHCFLNGRKCWHATTVTLSGQDQELGAPGRSSSAPGQTSTIPKILPHCLLTLMRKMTPWLTAPPYMQPLAVPLPEKWPNASDPPTHPICRVGSSIIIKPSEGQQVPLEQPRDGVFDSLLQDLDQILADYNLQKSSIFEAYNAVNARLESESDLTTTQRADTSKRYGDRLEVAARSRTEAGVRGSRGRMDLLYKMQKTPSE
ncbi:uncharacterized protein EI90DRAFT_3021959 [Cantharellus anzutake]|uniref:uncharacterized protein n=1 Tax=Cantharellus anzutake TaxID=1750568 RepID=UPI001907FEC3|nr:uncharacterized protein EI90DRAFT_3021959 [Cantharellus anzutake]KAF8315263.1 hypothetical protein EI90DRAFT_3021959 [Cantharellus anzutake]